MHTHLLTLTSRGHLESVVGLTIHVSGLKEERKEKAGAVWGHSAIHLSNMTPKNQILWIMKHDITCHGTDFDILCGIVKGVMHCDCHNHQVSIKLFASILWIYISTWVQKQLSAITSNFEWSVSKSQTFGVAFAMMKLMCGSTDMKTWQSREYEQNWGGNKRKTV